MILREYTPGESLAENEFLLKIREDNFRPWNDKTKGYDDWTRFKTGFLTKLTKKGEVPVKFADWGKIYQTDHMPTTYVWKEDYRSGWKLKSWRIGQSQEWAVVQHPEGFRVEIYLDNFLHVVLEGTTDQGVLIGEYRWEANTLIKK